MMSIITAMPRATSDRQNKGAFGREFDCVVCRELDVVIRKWMACGLTSDSVSLVFTPFWGDQRGVGRGRWVGGVSTIGEGSEAFGELGSTLSRE